MDVSKAIERVIRKLDRADRDLEDLRKELQSYDARRPYAFDETTHPMTGRPALRLRVLEDPDPEWEIELGAAAYQIRSALNQLVTAAVVANGGTVEKHRGDFPIAQVEADYLNHSPGKKSYRDRSLEGVDERVREVIDGAQPFRGWSEHPALPAALHPLARLSYLTNGDKHLDGRPGFLVQREIIPVVRDLTGRVRAVAFREGVGEASLPEPPPAVRLEDGAYLPDPSDDPAHAQPEELVRAIPHAQIEYVYRIGVTFGSKNIAGAEIASAARLARVVVDDVAPLLG